MTIQAVIKACMTKRNLFGRPIAWRGTGSAVDLARRLDPQRARRIVSFRSPSNLQGTEWNVDPQEFLDEWETVTAEELAAEVCQNEDPAV
jgi:hypothetical protein